VHDGVATGGALSLTALFLAGSGALFVATGLLIWRLAHVRNTTRGLVGNHSQVNRAFLRSTPRTISLASCTRRVRPTPPRSRISGAHGGEHAPIDLATVALGLAANRAWSPRACNSIYAMPAGAALLGAGLPQVSRMFKSAADRRQAIQAQTSCRKPKSGRQCGDENTPCFACVLGGVGRM